MEQKQGIEEVKKLFLAIIDLGNAAGSAFEDKKINLADIKDLMSMAHSFKEIAMDIDFKVAMPELNDLDASELEQLAILIEDNFDIPQDQVEDKVEKIFMLVARQHALIAEAIHMVRHPEAVG